MIKHGTIINMIPCLIPVSLFCDGKDDDCVLLFFFNFTFWTFKLNAFLSQELSLFRFWFSLPLYMCSTSQNVCKNVNDWLAILLLMNTISDHFLKNALQILFSEAGCMHRYTYIHRCMYISHVLFMAWLAFFPMRGNAYSLLLINIF